jgi:hypothetical protein
MENTLNRKHSEYFRTAAEAREHEAMAKECRCLDVQVTYSAGKWVVSYSA